jgi:hypothetical protein
LGCGGALIDANEHVVEFEGHLVCSLYNARVAADLGWGICRFVKILNPGLTGRPY